MDVVGRKHNFDVFLKTGKGGKADVMVVCHDPEWIFGVFPPVAFRVWLKERTGRCSVAEKTRWFQEVSCQFVPWFDPTCQGDIGRPNVNRLA